MGEAEGLRRSDRDGSTSQLSQLNRHWYRRRLDLLAKTLADVGPNPTVRELEKLCRSVITGFLYAITAQAPDLDSPQFPADRAFYIPFDKDTGKQFHFSKAYYQMLHPGSRLDALEQHGASLEGSLWSFLPGFFKNVAIDPEGSTGEDGETRTFQDLLGPSRRGRGGSQKARIQQENPVFCKSLLTSTGPQRPRDGQGWHQEVQQKLRHRHGKEKVWQALADLFEAFRTLPGASALEYLLAHQLHVLRWLIQTNGIAETTEGASGERGLNPLQMNDPDFRSVTYVLLRAYVTRPDLRPTAKQREILAELQRYLKPKESRRSQEPSDQSASNGDSAPANSEASVDRESSGDKEPRFDKERCIRLLREEYEQLKDRPFFRRIKDDLEADEEWEADGTPPPSEKIEGHLEEFLSHLRNFHDHFLRADNEHSLAHRVSRGEDDPWQAGSSESSFVRVCPDFDDLDTLLSLEDRNDWDRLDDSKQGRLIRLVRAINVPYRMFFQHHEQFLLKELEQAIDEYWRTEGQASRKARLYTSFEGTSYTAAAPPPVLPGFDTGYPEDGFLHGKPVPQTIYLRVRICDSLNEPALNGLFTFTTDYDEAAVWGKDSATREEDLEDLLAFAKVYFFIFRDFLHGLDRAREAADIGRLNQYLFDIRLQELQRALDDRLRKTEASREDLTKPEHWDRISFDVLNLYAESLLDKPEEVRYETFPYDRLLFLPLDFDTTSPSSEPGQEPCHKKLSESFRLPFYLFQSIFVEMVDECIEGPHYSLVKPFQSPLEDTEEGREFRARTFQKSYEDRDRRVVLERYLEKHYVGSRPVPSSPVRAGVACSRFGRDGDRSDQGALWSTAALLTFWRDHGYNRPDKKEAWRQFLRQLTRDWRQAMHPATGTSERDRRTLHHWLLFRLGLLAALLRVIQPDDEAFRSLPTDYRDNELKLRFDEDADLDVLWLTGGPRYAALKREENDHPPDPVQCLHQFRRNRSDEGSALRDLDFTQFLLRDQDPLILSFFEHLTQRVANRPSKSDSEGEGSELEAVETWYQPHLRRPLSRSTLEKDVIGSRMPDYDSIRNGEHALAMFLGMADVEVGRTATEARRLRCLIVMVRDYDDSKVGLNQSEREVEERLQSDLDDLTLFSRTFFQNVRRILNAARERQQVRVLSTDVQQIARNWYSTGVDEIIRQLQEQLNRLLHRSEEGRLSALQPEMVECLFRGTVQGVLARAEESRRDNKRIDLESFPFDRAIHLPLHLGEDSAVLCYGRFLPKPEGDEESAAPMPYERIRQEGRSKVLGKGKVPSGGRLIHVRRNAVPSLLDPVSKTVAKELEEKLTQGLLDRTAQDRVVRTLYGSNTLRTFFLGSTLMYLLACASARFGDEEGRFTELSRRIESLVQDGIRGLEQAGKLGGDGHAVLTEVDMEREVQLWPEEAHRGSGENLFTLVRDLLQLLEQDQEGWTYGLGEGRRSKLFYVFYSLPTPRLFLHSQRLGGRHRGMFCFLIDDASTDDKSADPTAELADQEDIRTLVHNAVGGLRLVLEQQILQERLRQPGVEQFISGMLHRLKNELNMPSTALHEVTLALRGNGGGDSHLLDKVAAAQLTLERIRETFVQLRSFGETRRGLGSAATRHYTTATLGWMVAQALVNSVKGLLDNHPLEGVSPDTVAKARSRLNTLENKVRSAHHASEERLLTGRHSQPGAPTKEPNPSIERQRIERVLHELTTLLEEYLLASSPSRDAEVLLSFHVASETDLDVRGSDQLAEAMNVLVENAIQATWTWIREQEIGNGGRISPRLQVLCRSNPRIDEQILLEIRNSSLPLGTEILQDLNSPTPRPIARQRYERSSHRKKGGSGFGHYFARRIISEFCGGRERGRRLDIQVDHDGRDLATIRVDLLEFRPSPSKPLPLTELLNSAVYGFPDLATSIRETARSLEEVELLVPGELEPLVLADAIHGILVLDQRLKEERIASILGHSLLPRVHSRVPVLQEKIAASLAGHLGANHQEIPEDLLGADLDAKSRRTRFTAFADWLQGWREREPEALKQIVDEGQGSANLLEPWLDAPGRDLEPGDLLREKERQILENTFRRFSPFFTPEAREAGSSCLLGCIQPDKEGELTVDHEGIGHLFVPARWGWTRPSLANGHFSLAFALLDVPEDVGMEEGEGNEERSTRVLDVFPSRSPTYLFAQYQKALEELDGSSESRLELIRTHRPESQTQEPPDAPGPDRVLGRTVRLVLPLANGTSKEALA